MSARNDTSMALSNEDKVFVQSLKGTLDLKTDKDALAHIIGAYRQARKASDAVPGKAPATTEA